MQTLIYNKNQKTVSLRDDSGLITTIEEVHSVDYTDKLYTVMILPQGTTKLMSVLKVPVGRTNYILENYK
jgi:hypothetical protein